MEDDKDHRERWWPYSARVANDSIAPEWQTTRQKGQPENKPIAARCSKTASR
jgi:hypothetical protein